MSDTLVTNRHSRFTGSSFHHAEENTLPRRIGLSALSLILAIGSSIAAAYNDTVFTRGSLEGRILGTIAPFAAGALLQTGVPREIVKRVRLEAWRNSHHSMAL